LKAQEPATLTFCVDHREDGAQDLGTDGELESVSAINGARFRATVAISTVAKITPGKSSELLCELGIRRT
jgi:hypothetical protein